ncbi:hypothetical protein DCAR_0312273 [Daucus carota subsp. sativus]|uniref:Uncharacterized protein n=1 Tax=Daucus carota subsp. sativus TaxID=79200 RepID=A0A166AX23_DAUCS|nr:hypothetical protein DCAR_0312273 [Daucus carota subsp. sativus]
MEDNIKVRNRSAAGGVTCFKGDGMATRLMTGAALVLRRCCIRIDTASDADEVLKTGARPYGLSKRNVQE